ncbi:hypothetical protein [Desulfomarina sp.]
MRETTKINRKSGSRTIDRADVTTEVSKVSITVVGLFGVVVGLWSLACLVGGLAAAGGPGQLAMGWFKAVTGM